MTGLRRPAAPKTANNPDTAGAPGVPDGGAPLVTTGVPMARGVTELAGRMSPKARKPRRSAMYLQGKGATVTDITRVTVGKSYLLREV